MLELFNQLSVAFFFFNDTATTEIYTLSLHDALPICRAITPGRSPPTPARSRRTSRPAFTGGRSEEHTSELQSQSNLVCRLLLEKKKIPILNQPYRSPCITTRVREQSKTPRVSHTTAE